MNQTAIMLSAAAVLIATPAFARSDDTSMLGSSTKPASNAAGADSPSGSGSGEKIKKHHSLKMEGRGSMTRHMGDGTISGGNL